MRHLLIFQVLPHLVPYFPRHSVDVLVGLDALQILNISRPEKYFSPLMATVVKNRVWFLAPISAVCRTNRPRTRKIDATIALLGSVAVGAG